MGEILIPRRTKVEKGYELLADITVGTATTSVDITGLNIGKSDEVVLVSWIYNTNSASGIEVYGYVNGNITNSNYYTQYIDANSATVGKGRVNFPALSYVAPQTHTCTITNFKLTNSGNFVFQSNRIMSSGLASVGLSSAYATSVFIAESITSIRLSASVTNSIGIGSRFQLYKLGGA